MAGKLEVKNNFLKSLSQNSDFFDFFESFDSCTIVDRKMRIKSKSYFQVNYSFMKPFSQNFDVLTQRCDVINPELARKRVQTGISCTNGDRIINYLMGTLR